MVLEMISIDRMAELLNMAFDNSPWITYVGYELPEDIRFGDFCRGGRFATELYHYPLNLMPMVDRCAIVIEVVGDKRKYKLTRQDLEMALEIIQDEPEYSEVAAALNSKTEDSDTADCLLQLAVFGFYRDRFEGLDLGDSRNA